MATTITLLPFTPGYALRLEEVFDTCRALQSFFMLYIAGESCHLPFCLYTVDAYVHALSWIRLALGTTAPLCSRSYSLNEGCLLSFPCL